MAHLIPNFGSCAWDSSGERRFAERLLSLLEDDYLCWFNVPIGTQRMHPDFVILHPRRGILVLEVKDWKLDSIRAISKNDVTLLTSNGLVTTLNPLKQSRQYAMLLTAILQRDPQLVHDPTSAHAGKLAFPWGYGAILTNITRRQFDATDLGEAMPSEFVICKDEMLNDADPQEFQQRLWNMFPQIFPCILTMPQMDRIRWHLFPVVRVSQGSLDLENSSERSQASEEIPDLVRVMDIQQEQLARSLGGGHRVIHGVAGSGKTMILGFRCQYLAQMETKPILVLCFNKALAIKLEQVIADKQLQHRVTVRNFHRWCRDQLVAYHVPVPTSGAQFHQEVVDRVIAAVDREQIPRAQYGAIMIDEGHDFDPRWFRLVVQMVDPQTNSLLVLYDDAQSLYGPARRSFRFSEVGIQARGRTTILRLNYRNTAEILAVAYKFAHDAMVPAESEDDGVPIIGPQSAGYHGPVPQLVRMAGVAQEIAFVRDRLKEFKSAGHAWGDMAVIYRHRRQGERLESELQQTGIPVALQGGASWDASSGTVKLLTMHSSKGLEFPVVLVAGICEMESDASASAMEAKLLYVAMTRSMRHLEMTYHRDTPLTKKVLEAIAEVA